MKINVTLETARFVTKLGIAPLGCWPLPHDAPRTQVFWHNVRWGAAAIQVIVCGLGLLYNIYENRHDPDRVILIFSELGAVSSTAAKMLICKKESSRLWVLINEVDMFVKNASDNERKVIQTYLDKIMLVNIMVLISAVLGPCAFILGPAVIPQRFPGSTAYPFSTERTWVWALLYLSQSICIVQVGCVHSLLDFLFSFLIWFPGARFEMLTEELEQATSAEDVRRCAVKHQELIEYDEI